MVRVDTVQDHRKRILEVQTFLIARAAKLVYEKIGPGFAENVYREALQKEFDQKRILYKQTCPAEGISGGAPAELGFRPDFLCFGKLVLFTMAAEAITEMHCRQLRECLLKLKAPVGLVVNFGREMLSMERVLIGKG
ncbi:MAG: GxxExxY protein [Calditrichia bacterium]|nr:GxxExxY protein [Calditrichia bacterium]